MGPLSYPSKIDAVKRPGLETKSRGEIMNVTAMPVRLTYQSEVTEECIADRRICLALVTLTIELAFRPAVRAPRGADVFI
jgi:hypothetical protein